MDHHCSPRLDHCWRGHGLYAVAHWSLWKWWQHQATSWAFSWQQKAYNIRWVSTELVTEVCRNKHWLLLTFQMGSYHLQVWLLCGYLYFQAGILADFSLFHFTDPQIMNVFSHLKSAQNIVMLYICLLIHYQVFKHSLLLCIQTWLNVLFLA